MAADGLRELPLELVVGFTTDFEASVLEDKIHGLGGLVSSRIPVRYGNTPEETCHIIQDAARNVLLSDEPHLSQFHLAGWGYTDLAAPVDSPNWSEKTGPALLNLPSWVPDWYQKQFNKPCIPGAFYQAGTADNTVTKDIRPVYRGDGISNLDLIEVSMSRIGVVSNILSSPFLMLDPQTTNLESPSFRGNLAVFVQQAKRLAHSSPQAISLCGVDSIDEIMWRTLFGDRKAETFPPLAEEELASLQRVVEMVTSTYTTDKNNPPKVQTKDTDDIHGTMFEIGRSWMGHRFCVLEGGHFGLVPMGTIPGDSVFIIWGVPTPFVVRSRTSHELVTKRKIDQQGDGGEHVPIGSCYLHSFMMGEATPARYKPEPIVLR